MKEQRKLRTFFSNKQCEYCKGQGSIIRFWKNKSVILCSSKKCDYQSKIKLGIFKLGQYYKG